jgi:hypothetical protein
MSLIDSKLWNFEYEKYKVTKKDYKDVLFTEEATCRPAEEASKLLMSELKKKYPAASPHELVSVATDFVRMIGLNSVALRRFRERDS